MSNSFESTFQICGGELQLWTELRLMLELDSITTPDITLLIARLEMSEFLE